MSNEKRRVLILDDEVTVCKLVRQTLTDQGYQVGYCTSADQFHTRLPQGWDLILMDLNLPGVSGLEILKQLKAGDHKLAPVIILTGEDNDEVLEACFSAGAVDYITKPFSQVTLTSRVRNSIGLYAEMNGHRRKVEDLLEEFARFVPQDLVHRIYEGTYNSGDLLECNYTVFFGDIRSYTTISEKLGPKAMGQMLDRLYRIMEKAISENGGTVNEFIGDAVMALFSSDEGPDNAVRAANALHKGMDEFNLIEKEVGIPVINMGVGIHSGEVLIGALGSQKKVTSTVIGDTVNVTARIEELTKRFGAKTLISHQIRDRLVSPPKHMRHIEHLRVRGREEPLDLFEVYEDDAPHIRHCKDSTRIELSKGVDHYINGRFLEALKLFRACILANPSDALVYDYIKRCQYYIKFPPSSLAHLNLGKELLLDWNVRRRFSRQQVNVRMTLRSSYKDMARNKVEAEVVNLSMRGICFKFHGYVREHDTVILELQRGEEGSERFSLTGKVQWTRDLGGDEMLIGMETQALTPDEQKTNLQHLFEGENQEPDKLKVLILDDDVSLCRQLRRTLQDHGIMASYVARAEDLFVKLQESHFDLLLLDLFMPGTDGFEVLRQLQSQERWSSLPVITMTSDTDDALIDRCFSLGASDFISKPPNVRALLSRIRASVDTAGLMRKKSDEVQLTNQKLKELLIQSEEDSRNKGMVLANMSHELRTPLNGLVSTVDLIEGMSPDEEDYAALHGLMKRSIRRLTHTVTSMLDFSNLESSHQGLQKKPFELMKTIKASLSPVQQRHEGKEISFELKTSPDLPETVVGDSTRLYQVLTALVDNAFKFTHRGGVSLHVRLVESNRERCLLRFEVSDTGIGFDETNANSLFESFVQHDSSLTRGYEGSGLGLSIAKRCCEIMNSKVQYQSQLGEGSRFWFDVEMGLVTEGEVKTKIYLPPQEKEAFPENWRGRLLLAEDNEDNVELIRLFLKEEPWDLVVAVNGLDALKRYSRESWDLILMDVHMPEMDGLEATRKIREVEKRDRTRTPIVALTALAQDKDRQACLDAGMDDYLSKPVTKDRLNKKLREWVLKS